MIIKPNRAVYVKDETLDQVLSRTPGGEAQLKILENQRESSKLSREHITTSQVTIPPNPESPLETEKLESKVIPGVKKAELIDLISSYTSKSLIDEFRRKFINHFRTNHESVNKELDEILDSYVSKVIEKLPEDSSEVKKIIDNAYSNLCAIEFSLNLQNSKMNPIKSYKRLLTTIASKKLNKKIEQNNTSTMEPKVELKKEDYRGMSVYELFESFSEKNNNNVNTLCFDTIREKFSSLYIKHKDDKTHLESDLNWLKKLSKQIGNNYTHRNTYSKAVENMIRIYEDRLKEFKPWWKKLW